MRTGELLATIEPDDASQPTSDYIEATRFWGAQGTTTWMSDLDDASHPFASGLPPRPMAAPRTIFIATLPGFILRRPLPVTIDESDGCVTAWSHDFQEYGAGADEAAAIDDFRHALIGLYLTLREHADRLGPQMAEQWTALRELIAP